ncbi:cysteine hydrolase family protein [Klebsiella variicola]|uniref:cysteine hydrolase family protein n=1 Tax=Klebsiella variicola TaxID=244366 RepID=UPI0015E9D2E8|nr:isochorismatase family cysteine hydrolase [Klebsiella variicola]QLS59448.1 cysteine hydrolase [Klebsiella variicola]
MALTTIDINTALIIVDLQNGTAGAPLIHPFRDIVDRSRALADACRQHSLPVVVVNVAGTAPGRTEQAPRFNTLPDGFSDIVPELEAKPDDIYITKHSWGAFATTDLEMLLREAGVTQVIITGVATGTGVEATARQAYEAGFNVTIAVDAITDVRPEAHEYSIRNVFPRLGETGMSMDIIKLLNVRGR